MSPVLAPAHRRVRRALVKRSRRAVILTYHRVARLPGYPFRTVVDPERFEGQMRLLREHYRPISLPQLVELVKERRVPPRSVVVTFDDGYADVLENAVPVMVRHGIPATLFVVSGAVGSAREQWWDRAERVAFAAAARGVPLSLDEGHSVEHEDDENGLGPEGLLRHLHHALLPLRDDRRHEVLDRLFGQMDLDPGPRPEHRFMSREELLEMAEAPGMDIGAHTVSHPLLAALPLAEQRHEIGRSRRRLEELIGRPVPWFCYPYGGEGAYSDETVRAVEEAGFEAACTTYHRPVGAGTPLLELPRCSVHDWDAGELQRRLDAFFMMPLQESVVDGKAGS